MKVKGVVFCLWFVFLGFPIATLESFPNSTSSTVRKRRQSSFNCTLPPQLENGRWLVTEADVKPGDQVIVNTIIRLECHEGYQLYPNIPLQLCDSNWDETTFPTCQKKCPSFYSTATTSVTCKDVNNAAVPCDKAVDGTYLTYNCNAYYEIPPGGRNILYCDDGVWDFPKPICQPICGKKVNTAIAAYAWGGREVKDFEFPWVVALYQTLGTSYENICGGTLISRRVVITAAHCVTNTYGKALDKNKFQVAAGKVYNAFGDKRDVNAQYRRVAGWGRTEEEKPSEILKAIRIPYKDGATCAKELPQSWEEQFNFFDKICAGRQNESIAVCEGDSGSGLVFKNREDNRYYLQGIVSIAPNLNTFQCNSQTNALYTSVPFYYSFIKREMTKNHLEDCILPAYPKNGKWFLEGGIEKKPGDIVLSSTILRFSCNMRHILSSRSPYYDCQSFEDHPTCLRVCPKISLPAGSQILCKNFKDQYIDCNDIADGSSITFTCPNGFVSDRGTPTSTRYCRNGVYGNSAPSCTDIKQKSVYVSNTLYKSKPKIEHAPTTTTRSRITTPKSEITSKEPTPIPTIKNEIKMICYYARWMAYNGSHLEDFEPRLCTHLIYEHIGLSSSGELDLKESGLDLLQMTMDFKKKNKDLKVMINIGADESGNLFFNRLSTNNQIIEPFLSSVVKIMRTYSFDGLEIHWFTELSKKAIYINLLKQIKQRLEYHGWLLSVDVFPYLKDIGYDPKEMDRIVDWVTIRPRDLYTGARGYVDLNTSQPTFHRFHDGENGYDSKHIAESWLDAGLSKEKLIIGVEFYGVKYRQTDTLTTLEKEPVKYAEICSNFNTSDVVVVKDMKTEIVYLFNFTNSYWIGFYDENYIRSKGHYVKQNKLGGVAAFAIEFDDYKGTCGKTSPLILALLVGLGVW
ncbi:uncharacterized protein LOC126885068 isoform X2 [Diabrotica virgifera virgifera]|uniref:Uncharacterized protein n=1 Tax=Diabrotica virgifera virgifera TaxID=50390 RepID=A0ABM5KB90_DIAVI|nr:uncharacterized protein LOC126885068 isoform X2 [Diabrotica virgifera virgifera]